MQRIACESPIWENQEKSLRFNVDNAFGNCTPRSAPQCNGRRRTLFPVWQTAAVARNFALIFIDGRPRENIGYDQRRMRGVSYDYPINRARSVYSDRRDHGLGQYFVHPTKRPS